MCGPVSPGESKDRSRHMATMATMSADGGENGIGVGSVRVDSDSSPGEDGGGAPRHSSRFVAVTRSPSRSESM